MSIMKRWIALLLVAGLALWQLPLKAQPRLLSQPELDALLAPIALYPDSVLSHVLVAAKQPQDLRSAAAWSRANPQLSGESAVQAAEPIPWHPSVKALVAFPDLLVRMDESPQWTADLATAFIEQEPYVMDTVQALRRRAQASGALQSNPQYTVQQEGPSIAVYPAQPGVVYVPYYDPYVVYGPWWWPAYRPVFWRPWHARPVFFSSHFVGRPVDWHRRTLVGNVVHQHNRVIHDQQPRFRDQRAPLRTHQSHRALPHPAPIRQFPRPVVGPAVSIPSHSGSSVRPIVDSVRLSAQGAAQPQPQTRHESPRFEHRREDRPPAQQQRQGGQNNSQHSNRRG